MSKNYIDLNLILTPHGYRGLGPVW